MEQGELNFSAPKPVHPVPAARFNGPAYEPRYDLERLTGQIRRIYDLMIDGAWRTLDEIHRCTRDPPASISAQLRHLRKRRFGGHTINKRRRGDEEKGLWEYQLIEGGKNEYRTKDD